MEVLPDMKAACMIAHRQEAGVEIPMFVTLQAAPFATKRFIEVAVAEPVCLGDFKQRAAPGFRRVLLAGQAAPQAWQVGYHVLDWEWWLFAQQARLHASLGEHSKQDDSVARLGEAVLLGTHNEIFRVESALEI